MQEKLDSCGKHQLKQLSLLDPDNNVITSTECLPKVFERVFEYTPHIKEAHLVSCSFDPTTVMQGHEAHLRNISTAEGEFTIEVPMHEHLLASLRIRVSPSTALLRSKNEILDSMNGVRTYLNGYLASTRLESYEVKKLKKQTAEIEAVLKALPNAKPEELVLVTIHTLIAGCVGSTGTGSAWPTTVVKHLVKMRAKTFPSAASIHGALQILSETGAIEPTRVRQRLALKPKGRDLVKALLKK